MSDKAVYIIIYLLFASMFLGFLLEIGIGCFLVYREINPIVYNCGLITIFLRTIYMFCPSDIFTLKALYSIETTIWLVISLKFGIFSSYCILWFSIISLFNCYYIIKGRNNILIE